MRIHLAASYFLHPSSNGAAVLTRQIAQLLKGEGAEVTVSCFKYGGETELTPSVETLVQDGLPVTAITRPAMPGGRTVPLADFLVSPAAQTVALSILKDAQPDILYAHSARENAPSILAAHALGIPVALHVHDFSHMCGRLFLNTAQGAPCSGPDFKGKCAQCLSHGWNPARKLATALHGKVPGGPALLQAVLGKAKASSYALQESLLRLKNQHAQLRKAIGLYITSAESIAAVEVAHGAHPNKIITLPYYLPANRIYTKAQWKAYKSAAPINAQHPLRICFFGRLSPEKGLPILQKAIQHLSAAERAKITLVIISQQANPADAPELARAAGIYKEQIEIHNTLAGEKLMPVLAACDVCAAPSTCREIGPLTLLEAYGAGTPCMVSSSCALASTLHTSGAAQNGCTFPAGNISALRAHLENLLNNPTARAQLQTWAENRPTPPTQAEYSAGLNAALHTLK